MAQDHVNPEEEYFHQQEREKLEKLRREAETARNQQAAADLKELHFHKCGKCGNDMDTSLYKGIEIEVCATCGSVLLDPGELQELAGEDDSGFFQAVGDMFRFTKKP